MIREEASFDCEFLQLDFEIFIRFKFGPPQITQHSDVFLV